MVRRHKFNKDSLSFLTKPRWQYPIYSAAVALLSGEQIGYGMDEAKVVTAPPPRENNFNHER